MGGGYSQQFAALCSNQRAWLYRLPIGTSKAPQRVAHRTATQAEAGESTETTPLCGMQRAAASFLPECFLADDFATREIDGQGTETHRAHLSSKFGPPHRLSVESGICDAAQRASSRGIGGLAQASKAESCDGTHQLCQRDSSRLCRCLRCLLLALE